MGTPDFAVATLRMLVETGHNVVAVVTQPDRPRGRHAEVRAPEVKSYALERGIPVLQPERLKDETFLKELASYRADLQVVVAFRMLPKEVWDMPRWGTFNVHASLLPKYRGAAPINWAIIGGESVTGVTTFMLDHKIDTGRIILQRQCVIPPEADVKEMHDSLKDLGARLAVETIDIILATHGNPPTMDQNENLATTAAPKLFKDNCEIDWQRTAKEVCDFVRGLSPTPGAWTRLSFTGVVTDEQEMKVYRAKNTKETCYESPGTVHLEKRRILVAAKDYWVELLDVQLSGRRRMQALEVLNGFRG